MPSRPIQLDSIPIERAAPFHLKCLASTLHSPACSLKASKGHPALCVAYSGQEQQPILTEKVAVRGMIVGVRRGPKLVEMSIDDGSGELLSCVLWESSAEAWRQLPDEATELLCRVVGVKGHLRTFRNKLQIRITSLEGIYDYLPDQEAQWWLDVVEEWDLVQTRIFEHCICPRPAEIIQLGPISCQRYTLCPCRCHRRPDFPCYVSDCARRLPPAFASAVAAYRTVIRVLIDWRRHKGTIPSSSEIRDFRRAFEATYTRYHVPFDENGTSIRLSGKCVSKCVAAMAIEELVTSGELSRDEDGTLKAHDLRREALDSVRHWVASADDTQPQKVSVGELGSAIYMKIRGEVYFYVVMEDIDEVGGVFYHFEHDDLVLSRDTPTPVDNLKRLDSAIRAKTLTRSFLDIRTPFELTRVTNDGDGLPDEPTVKEASKETAIETSSVTSSSSQSSWGLDVDTSNTVTELSIMT
ncbi:hypothetical protein Pmar_PMAR005439, partial [Perkinsus marinus ATCC 50983]